VNRRHTLLVAVVLGLLLAAGASFAADASAVRVWETKTVIPTYLAGDPEPNPLFFFGRQSQGAQGPVYPIPCTTPSRKESRQDLHHCLFGKRVHPDRRPAGDRRPDSRRCR